MERRDALRMIGLLPINLMQDIPGIGTFQIYLKDTVKIEVFFKGEKVTVDPAEVFEALKKRETA